MKTIIIEKPGQIKIVENPMPKRKENEVLLKIRYCGICGADVASYTGNQPFTTYPRIPGHEFSAEIAEIDPNPYGLKIGDVVTANPYFNCKSCYSCERGFVNCCTDNQTMGVQRDGSFSEYITMPIERIIPGKGLSAKELALIEPFSISYHALSRAHIEPTDTVLVVGAGPIGLFALISAKMRGATVYVADTLQGRLDMALEYGAHGVINVSEKNLMEAMEEITEKKGFDVCVEACGLSETFLNCIDAVCFAGKIILIGNGKKETTFLHSVLLKKELNVFGSRNAYTKDFKALIQLVSQGKVDLEKMISKIYPAQEAAEAFEALVNNDGSLKKVLLEM